MKFTLMIVGALLLLQYAHSIPVTDPSSSASSRECFVKEIFKQLESYFLNMLRGVSEVFESVVEKAEYVEHPSNELKKQLVELRKFISDVNGFSKGDDGVYKMCALYNLTTQMVTLKEGYVQACRNHPEAFPTSLLLSNNGFKALEAKAVPEFLDFVKKFTQTFDAFVAELSPESAKKEQKLINWFRQYNELNTDNKYGFILTFMENANNI